MAKAAVRSNPLKDDLLTLVEKPYDEYNTAVLPVIKQKLGAQRVPVFETDLAEQLQSGQVTGRQAFRHAVLVALGELKPEPPRERKPRAKKQEKQ